MLIAATINHVPLDVLAERLSMSRGAVYATIQEARRKLRSAVDEKAVPARSSSHPETMLEPGITIEP